MRPPEGSRNVSSPGLARHGWAAAALLAAAFLAGCSSGPAMNTGPFGNGGSPGEECIEVPAGKVLSYGFEAFSNSGPAATIERAGLADPHGLRVLAAYAVPITGTDLYGVWFGYPPTARISRRGCNGPSGSGLTARISRIHGDRTPSTCSW